MAKSYIGLGRDEFEKFVACPKCCALYKTEECTVRRTNGRVVSKKCDYVRFPNHPQTTRRKQCGALLMKQMRSKNGSAFLYPKKLYCFRKLSDSLRAQITSPGGKETSLEIQWVMYLKAEFGKNSWILMEILTSQKQEAKALCLMWIGFSHTSTPITVVE